MYETHPMNPNPGTYTSSVGYGTASAINAQAAPPPNESQSVIRDAITQSEQFLSDLHTAIELVEKRLDTALTPTAPPPGNQADGRVPKPVGSHVVGRLGILNEGMMHAIQRLHGLRSRIEI